MRTQVGIIGAGPAGLMLAHLLRAHQIDCVILEARSRDYAEGRIRAGVLEQGTVDLLEALNLADRLKREGLQHHGIELGFRGQRHRIDMTALTGKSVTVYGQHEVVKDLIAAAAPAGIEIMFEVENVALNGIRSLTPSISFKYDGVEQTLACDFIAGCDGFHGICRPSVPEGQLKTFERVYPFSWLGILADAAPSKDELVYMNSDRGFALFSMRSPRVTRLYLQCAPTERLEDWSDKRIWNELALRFEGKDGWQPSTGLITQKSITPMRSFVTEPMQYGRLFLAGDAVHIVPPTGAKGMNLAISDVKVLAECLSETITDQNSTATDRYSEVCLRRIWKAQRFSWWMTTMLHNDTEASEFDRQRQLAELDYVVTSEAAAKVLAENYVGLPTETTL